MRVGHLGAGESHARSRFVILCAVLVVLLVGCGKGGDRLDELIQKFPSYREGLNEARELIHALAVTEGIFGVKVGASYNEALDNVWLRHNSSPEPLEAVSFKDPQNKSKLARLRTVARNLSCVAVIVDELNRVQVVMYSGRNVDYGYEFVGSGEKHMRRDGDYLAIPGEAQWHAFRR